jgi:hypothetical protein
MTQRRIERRWRQRERERRRLPVKYAVLVQKRDSLQNQLHHVLNLPGLLLQLRPRRASTARIAVGSSGIIGGPVEPVAKSADLVVWHLEVHMDSILRRRTGEVARPTETQQEALT